MTQSRTVHRKFHVKHTRKGHRVLVQGEAPPPVVPPRIPRLSRLMALAIRFDRLIREGHVIDQMELAELGHVTSARLSQIMNLLLLAPDIQESLLFLELGGGRDQIHERGLRSLVTVLDWGKQRQLWLRLAGNHSSSCGVFSTRPRFAVRLSAPQLTNECMRVYSDRSATQELKR